tara:strand:- start:554 stop:1567 length:1014 start_codon:yes stop_codon:yes gene_type:complete
MYIENNEGFDGEGDLYTRFGVEIRDEATFIVSRTRFSAQVRRPDNDIATDRPTEGDLIYLPLANKMFEIQHVEHEQPFYQIENLPVYKMRCTLFEYSGEDFDTGIEDIQDIEKTGSYQYVLSVIPTGNGAATATLNFPVLDSGVPVVGTVDSLLLTDSGNYYTTPPTIRFIGGGDSSFSLGDSATATATVSGGRITGITLTDGGTNYSTVPSVNFSGGNTGVDSAYSVGDTVQQTLTGNINITGEIQRIVNDSAGDSSQHIYLAHVGADDGKYHNFVTGSEIINITQGGIVGRGLTVTGVREDNKISETEQNDIFRDISDDFLDFSEDNPFGDAENN